MSVTEFVKDGVTKADYELFSSMVGVKCRADYYLTKENPFSYAADRLLFAYDVLFELPVLSKVRSFKVVAGTTLSSADLDAGAFVVGTDYYVYLVMNGADPTLKISANSTYPAGCSADNSMKIGQFHYGHIRKVSSDGLMIPVDGQGIKFGTGVPTWQQNITVGIVPNSVSDLLNRPKCGTSDGMVKIGHIWVDIYQASAASALSFESATNGLHISAGLLQSKYGQLPVTGTEGANWYTFAELAERSKKRLMSYGEWVRGAYGNPQGQDAADDYGWTKTTNTARARTGVRVNASSGAYDAAAGIKPYALSAYNLADCVGNVYEWLDEMSNRHDSTAWAWQDVLGAGKGQLYGANSSGIVAHIAGGGWYEGVHSGARTVGAGNMPWGVSTGIGCRLACDAR